MWIPLEQKTTARRELTVSAHSRQQKQSAISKSPIMTRVAVDVGARWAVRCAHSTSTDGRQPQHAFHKYRIESNGKSKIL